MVVTVVVVVTVVMIVIVLVVLGHGVRHRRGLARGPGPLLLGVGLERLTGDLGDELPHRRCRAASLATISAVVSVTIPRRLITS